MGSVDTRWRWIVFVRSVLSTVDNPGGPLFRALGRELVRRGQEALFLEERVNPSVQALLRQRGAAGMAELREGWPELAYQTYERRFGADLVEWLGRTLATADVALVELGVDPALAHWVGELTRPYLRTYLLDLMPDTPSLAGLRGQIDASRYSGVICSAAVAAGYEERLPASQLIVAPIDLAAEPAEHGAARLADLLLELLRAAPPAVP